MNNLKILLKNHILLLTAVGLLLLSLFFSGTVMGMLKADYQDEEILKDMDWLIPLGTYDTIHAAEVKGQVVFRVRSASWKPSSEYYYSILDVNGEPAESGWNLTDAEVNGRLELKIHPEGYYVNRYYEDRDILQDMTGKYLGSVFGGSLELTEKAGYFIDRNSGKILCMENGGVETAYEPEKNERVLNQMGDFWIMEADVPVGDRSLPVQYLRDMNFEIAMDGLLVTDLCEITDSHITGSIVTNGTYYDLPNGQVIVEHCVMTHQGDILYPTGHAADEVLLGADEGYWTALENQSTRNMYFYDGTEPILLGKDVSPTGPCRDGMFVFLDEEGHYGIMNQKGVVLVEPVFDQMSGIHQNTAVVVYGGKLGVIQVKGGMDS